jgi:hypothetical protein
MSVPTALADLTDGCRQLRAELDTLGLTLREDTPADLAVVDRLGRAVDDLGGRAEEASCGALRAAEAAARLDLVGAHHQLAATQAALTALAERFRDDVTSYEALEPVVALRHRGQRVAGLGAGGPAGHRPLPAAGHRGAGGAPSVLAGTR